MRNTLLAIVVAIATAASLSAGGASNLVFHVGPYPSAYASSATIVVPAAASVSQSASVVGGYGPPSYVNTGPLGTFTGGQGQDLHATGSVPAGSYYTYVAISGYGVSIVSFSW